MKVALILSGKSHAGVGYIERIKKYAIENIDPDVYIHSYKCEDLSAIEDAYKPVASIWEDEGTTHDIPDDILFLYQNHTGRDSPQNNTINMWRKRWAAFNMIKEIHKYDRVMIGRFDCYSNESISDYLAIDKIVIPRRAGWQLHLMNDCIAAGSPEKMKYYCSIGSYFTEYRKQGVDFHPETLLKYHLDQRMDKDFTPIWQGVDMSCFVRENPYP